MDNNFIFKKLMKIEVQMREQDPKHPPGYFSHFYILISIHFSNYENHYPLSAGIFYA
jgi:hypothetical protein